MVTPPSLVIPLVCVAKEVRKRALDVMDPCVRDEAAQSGAGCVRVDGEDRDLALECHAEREGVMGHAAVESPGQAGEPTLQARLPSSALSFPRLHLVTPKHLHVDGRASVRAGEVEVTNNADHGAEEERAAGQEGEHEAEPPLVRMLSVAQPEREPIIQGWFIPSSTSCSSRIIMMGMRTQGTHRPAA